MGMFDEVDVGVFHNIASSRWWRSVWGSYEFYQHIPNLRVSAFRALPDYLHEQRFIVGAAVRYGL